MTPLRATLIATMFATALLLAGTARAQAADAASAPAPAAAPAPTPAAPEAPAQARAHGLRLLAGGALTYGGDELESVPMSDGTTRHLRAGGLINLWGGVEFRPAGSPVAGQATIGYHVDCICATNGDIMFSRMPLELIAMADVGHRLRLGLGYRHTFDVHLRSSGAAAGAQQDFQSSDGLLVQGEWMATPRMGVVVRVVSEKYGYSQSYVDGSGHIVNQHLSADGTHGGIGLNWYFL